MRGSARLSALIALAAMAAGCNDGPAAPLPIPVEPVTTAAQQAGPARTHSVFISSTGLSMERAEMQPVLTELTRQVALALGDPVTRMAVFDALHASPYREHKLRLRTLLTQAGSPLAAAIAQRSMRRPAAVLATLDSVIDLEIYLPVPSHFIQWHGGPEVLVASVLDRSDVPIAFDGEGTAIPSMSAVVPPNRPTIVLVQVETDFSAPGVLARQDCFPTEENDYCGGGGGGGGGGVPPANTLRLAGINITNDHEPWTSGSPEFEIWVFAANADGTIRTHEELYLYPYSHYETKFDAAGCVSDKVPTTSASYWDYNTINTFTTYTTPQPTFFTVSDSTLYSAYRWDVLVTEDDDPGPDCPNYFPSIGNPDPTGNDDDLVGRTTLPAGLGPIGLSSFGDVGRLVLSYGP